MKRSLHLDVIPNGMQASCSWLTLYGLMSSLAHLQHHPQVKPCIKLLDAGSLSWPLMRDCNSAGSTAVNVSLTLLVSLPCRA